MIKRIKRLPEEKHLDPNTSDIGGDTSEDTTNHEKDEPSFEEGVSRLL